MSGPPWVRFFPSDWLAGTRGLSAVETGVYISLIAMMYERGEPLPEDRLRLARVCGTSGQQFVRAINVLIEHGKVIRTDVGLWNERVEKEFIYLSRKSVLGTKAANSRWEKDKQKQRPSDASASIPHRVRIAAAYTNQKPEVRYQKKEDRIHTPRESNDVSYFEF